MKQQYKQIVENLGYQLNITLLEEQLEGIMDALVKECAQLAEIAEPYQTADLIKRHFGVRNDV